MKNNNPASDAKELFHAVEKNDISTVRKLVDNGLDVNARDKGDSTPLMRASLHAYSEIVAILIQAGADVNAQDKIGKTALHYAAQEYHEVIVEKLIEAKAKINSQDIHGNSVLSDAVFYSKGRGTLIALLRQHGANDNLPNKHGVTPLALARTIANYDVIQFFN